jgi:phosphoserine phosphatase
MRWPPFNHVFFDCDSTLAQVEGIDALARAIGKGWRVSVLTEAAMSGDVDLEEVYAKRLQALKPTKGQIQAIRQIYKQNVVPDAAEVIMALQSLGHQVYILSGGLAEPVIEFGRFLGVPGQNIRAVEVEYDLLSGDWWWQVDEDQPNVAERILNYSKNPLTISDGKALLVKELLGDQLGRSLLIGDGVSDLLASRAVDLFVGFGGVVSRSRVQSEAPLFINSSSLAPLLAIAAGPAGLTSLEGTGFQTLVDKTKSLIGEGAITFQSDELKIKFNKAWQAAHKTIYPRSY